MQQAFSGFSSRFVGLLSFFGRDNSLADLSEGLVTGSPLVPNHNMSKQIGVLQNCGRRTGHNACNEGDRGSRARDRTRAHSNTEHQLVYQAEREKTNNYSRTSGERRAAASLKCSGVVTAIEFAAASVRSSGRGQPLSADRRTPTARRSSRICVNLLDISGAQKPGSIHRTCLPRYIKESL